MKDSGQQLVKEIAKALASQDHKSAHSLVQNARRRSWIKKLLCGKKTLCGNALMLAAESERFDVVDVILECGVSIDEENSDGMSALEVVAIRGRYEVAIALLQRGARPSRRQAKYCTAFKYAALYGHIQLVAEMLAYDADIEDITSLGGASLFRIQGSILRLIRDAGGVFDSDIDHMLDGGHALGD